MKELTYAVVFLAGTLGAIQAAINARLGQALGNGMQAVLVSFIIGGAGALLYCLVAGAPLATGQALRAGPWWMWTGGLLGAVFVWSTIIAVPRIGVALTFPLLVAGQMATAVILEHFGILGSPRQPISWARVGGALLVVAGVVVLGMTRRAHPAEG